MTEDAELSLVAATIMTGGHPIELLARMRERGVSSEAVLAGFNRAMDMASEDQPFEVHEAIPPGSLDLRVFDQAEVWVDVLRVPHQIADPDDLTDDYLHNLLGHLEQNADYFALAYSLMGSAPVSSGTEWLEGTVLMRALRAEAVARGLYGDAERHVT